MEEKPNKPSGFGNEEESKFLVFSCRSITGILYLLAALGNILMLIGTICPFFSYNPTVIDDFKRTVSFYETGWLTTLALIIWAISFVLFALMYFVIAKANWKSKFGKITGICIGHCVALAIAVILILIESIVYEIPEEAFAYLVVNLGSGAYLFIVGACLAFFFCIVFYLFIRDYVKTGKNKEALTIGRRAPGGVSSEKRNSETATKTLEEKLRELQKLKNDGLLSEEEFEVKKEELLKEYH